MDARLRLQVGDIQLEIEGSEAFVEKIYNDHKGRLTSKGSSKNDGKQPDSPVGKEGRQSKRRSNKSVKGLHRIDLNLRPAGKPSLKEFVAEYKEPTKDELYLLCIAYLRNALKVDGITVDHVYTCLDELGQRVPTYLRQVLTNTKNEKGWIDTTNFEKLTTTIKGDNHMKLDMEKA
jgi:hypothetical protein